MVQQGDSTACVIAGSIVVMVVVVVIKSLLMEVSVKYFVAACQSC